MIPESIQVSIDKVFGKEKIYPICNLSKLFAKLVKQKTLTREDVQKIKMMGFKIEVIQPEVSL